MVKEVMSLKEVAEYLSFSQKKLYNLVKKGQIPHLRIGGQYRFLKKEIERWLQEQKTKTPASALSSIMEKQGLEKRLLFVGFLTKELLKYNIKPIIVGGNAVEFYTLGGYATEDIDLICSDYQKLGEILETWGFIKKGRHWLNEKYDLLIESPADVLQGSLNRITEVEILGLSVYLIGIEDIIIDRLNAYVHWQSEADGLWAKKLLVLNKEEIDWEYLEKRCGEEKTVTALEKIKESINEKI